MMQAVKLIALCMLSHVGALDIFIDGPALLLDCRSDSGQLMTESTTTSVSTEAPVDPKELYDAASRGDLSFINTAISQLTSSGLDLNWRNTDDRGYTALHIAAEEDQPSIVAALLDAGADPDVQDDYGRTAVYIAAGDNRISVLRLLLDLKYHGGDPNKTSTYGTSPLMMASSWGYVEAVRMLIQAGAHVDYVRPSDGYTALHMAAWENKADAARLLLENGADKNKQDDYGNTAADVARLGEYHSVAQLIDNY